MRFDTIAATQAYLDSWETRWADRRIHRTTKRQVSAMLVKERPFLQPLPLQQFHCYRHGSRSVHLYGCVEVEAEQYSVPPGGISSA